MPRYVSYTIVVCNALNKKMAILYPSIETILLANSYQPTESEIKVIDFLRENLSDEFEIFFKPMLNGDTPDIVLVKKTSGVLLTIS